MEGSSFGFLLPEILHEIFEYLEAEDLASVSMVCHHWRSVANSDILWKKICENEGIFDEFVDFSNLGRESNLCHWATVYIRYHQNIDSNWKKDRHVSSDFPCEVENIEISGKTMVVSFLTWRLLNVFHLENGLFVKKQILSPNIPGFGCHFICLKRNQLIVSSNNIFIHYSKSGNQNFKKEATFAYHDSISPIDDDLSHHFSPDIIIKAMNIHQNHISLFDLQNTILFYTTHKTTKIHDVIGYESSDDKIVVFYDSTIACFLYDGTQIVKIDGVLTSVSMNDNFFCFYDKDVFLVDYEGTVCRFEVKDVKNMILQRKKDFLYILRTKEVSFLECYTPQGALVWQTSCPRLSDRAELYEVLGKYLVLYPFISRDLGGAMGVYDLKNGDFLYHSELNGKLVFCENRFIVGTDIAFVERRLKKYLRSYAAKCLD